MRMRACVFLMSSYSGNNSDFKLLFFKWPLSHTFSTSDANKQRLYLIHRSRNKCTIIIRQASTNILFVLSFQTGTKLIPLPSQCQIHGKTTVTALQETSITHEITEKTLQIETKVYEAILQCIEYISVLDELDIN